LKCPRVLLKDLVIFYSGLAELWLSSLPAWAD
jgi:hypothetical protein